MGLNLDAIKEGVGVGRSRFRLEWPRQSATKGTPRTARLLPAGFGLGDHKGQGGFGEVRAI